MSSVAKETAQVLAVMERVETLEGVVNSFSPDDERREKLLAVVASELKGARTALTQATSNYTAATQVNLYVSGSGNSFHAENASYGANGWEGYTDWNCLNFGRKSSATSRLNMYYLDGSSVTTGRRKVVWLHELGHGLGLGHVPSIYHVMHQSASQAYLNGGVRSLTSDEIAGINSWY